MQLLLSITFSATINISIFLYFFPSNYVGKIIINKIVSFRTMYPDRAAQLAKLRQHLLDTTSDLAPLKAWQLQELSLQASERIMSSATEEALKTFTLIAHNFPLQVSKRNCA